MRVAIIGAGIAGLAAARHTLVAGNIDVTVFEQSDRIGGNWAYRECPGVDEYGLQVSSSAYPGLMSNSPIEITCYPDFPYGKKEDHSFLRADEIIAYLDRFVEHFKITRVIRFRHHVINVRPQCGSTAWEVTTRNVLESAEKTDIFDSVIVCNGHFSVPSFPEDLSGRDIYRGRQVHSHTYRGASAFAGRSVLVIGSGPSALDLTWDIRTVTAKLLISAHGKCAKWMANAHGAAAIRPDVAALTENGARFTDGSEEDFDTILYCTGYQYSFPFLDAECSIRVHNNHVQPLFKHVVNIERPTMFMIGLTNFGLLVPVIDTQARLVVSLLQGKWQLPDRHEMERVAAADLQRCWDAGYAERNAHKLSDFVYESVAELEELFGAETRIRPVLFKIFQHFSERMATAWGRFRQEKITIVDDETFTTEYPTSERASCIEEISQKI